MKTVLSFGTVLGAIALITIFWITSCAGPKPTVVEATFDPPAAAGQPYHLRALVENGGGGRGEVGITFRMKDQASGRIYEEQSTLTLKPHEQALAVAQLALPAGDYTLKVEAEYPPQ